MSLVKAGREKIGSGSLPSLHRKNPKRAQSWLVGKAAVADRRTLTATIDDIFANLLPHATSLLKDKRGVVDGDVFVTFGLIFAILVILSLLFLFPS